MFASYKKHNNKLYNKLVELSRNKFFYQDFNLKDHFETRVLLIFFHFIIILKAKKNAKLKKDFQNLFDNIFQNIEIDIRELGYGDTKVNKTMKTLNKIFYDILFKIEKKKNLTSNDNKDLLIKYFYKEDHKHNEKAYKLGEYMEEFQNFCFDSDVDNMLNGSINFKFR